MKKDYIIITILALVLAVIIGFTIYKKPIEVNKNHHVENNNNNNNIHIENNEIKPVTINKYNEESDIKKDDKINIYFFWRIGCAHCKAQFEYLENNFYKYEDKYNLYCFEIMENENNNQLMDKFSKALGEDIRGVPFTIVGDRYKLGFSNEASDDLKNLIENEMNNNKHIDLYFDKIKM